MLLPSLPLYYKCGPLLPKALPSIPPLVFIHGLDSASDTFTEVLARLGTTYPCLALDLRGHGRSPMPPLDEPDFSLTAVVGDVQDFLKSQELNDVVLVGHSMGGRVAIPLAQRLGDRCRGLIIEDIDLEPRKQRDVSPIRLDMLKSFRRRHKTAQEVVDELGKYGYEEGRVRAWLSGGGRIYKDGEELVVGIHPLASTLEVNSLLATTDAAESFAKIAASPNRPPVLLFRADIQAACSEEGARRMKAMMPDMEQVLIPGSVHSVHSSHLHEYCDVITRFMGKIAGDLKHGA